MMFGLNLRDSPSFDRQVSNGENNGVLRGPLTSSDYQPLRSMTLFNGLSALLTACSMVANYNFYYAGDPGNHIILGVATLAATFFNAIVIKDALLFVVDKGFSSDGVKIAFIPFIPSLLLLTTVLLFKEGHDFTLAMIFFGFQLLALAENMTVAYAFHDVKEVNFPLVVSSSYEEGSEGEIFSEVSIEVPPSLE